MAHSTAPVIGTHHVRPVFDAVGLLHEEERRLRVRVETSVVVRLGDGEHRFLDDDTGCVDGDMDRTEMRPAVLPAACAGVRAGHRRKAGYRRW